MVRVCPAVRTYVCVLLIINEDSKVYVMVMQPPVLSLAINNQVPFDVATMSEVALFFFFCISCGM